MTKTNQQGHITQLGSIVSCLHTTKTNQKNICSMPTHDQNIPKKHAIQLGFVVLCLHMTKIDLCYSPTRLSYFMPTHGHEQPLLLHAYTQPRLTKKHLLFCAKNASQMVFLCLANMTKTNFCCFMPIHNQDWPSCYSLIALCYFMPTHDLDQPLLFCGCT